jgi:hypothetical protein
VRIETVELDYRNLAHATSRVSATEIRQVFENGPELRRNRVGSDRGLRRHRRDRWRFASADQLHLQRPGRRRPVSAWRLP